MLVLNTNKMYNNNNAMLSRPLKPFPQGWLLNATNNNTDNEKQLPRDQLIAWNSMLSYMFYFSSSHLYPKKKLFSLFYDLFLIKASGLLISDLSAQYLILFVFLRNALSVICLSLFIRFRLFML